MEVSSYQPVKSSAFDQPSMSLNEGNEMDIDMEIDLGPIHDDEFIQSVSNCSHPQIAQGKHVLNGRPGNNSDRSTNYPEPE